MKFLFFTLLFSVNVNCHNQNNYYIYNNKINNAEILYFMENKVDSSLAIYNEVFDTYEFIFLKDLLNAAQIAVFNNKDYEKYLFKSFEFGFRIDDLNKFPLFKDIHKKYQTDKRIMMIFKKARIHYLKKIDLKYLDYIYNIAIKDQIDKYKFDYDTRIYKSINNLMDTIKRKGFPGERLLGITDTLIFKENGLKKLDINERSRKQKITNHFIYRANRLHFGTSIPILLHHRCVSSAFKDVFLVEIKKGNMHPQDLAFINDFNSQFLSKLPAYCNGIKFEGLYSFSPSRGDLIDKKRNRSC